MLFDDVDETQHVVVVLPERTFTEAALGVQEGLFVAEINISYFYKESFHMHALPL